MSDNAHVFDRSQQIYLKPGEFYFGRSPQVLKTLLGSCVAITLWHPVRHIGGMCHFLLPTIGSAKARLHDPKRELDGRYGCDAAELFLQHIRKHGASAKEYEAKIFGGSNMFPALKNGGNDVGRKNIEFAKNFLKQQGIALKVEHVGDSGHRTLIFDLQTGHCWLKSSV